ncbi:MAG: hypothetical protein ACTSWP_07405 [Candidatus Freyarchaeota archaeon]
MSDVAGEGGKTGGFSEGLSQAGFKSRRPSTRLAWILAAAATLSLTLALAPSPIILLALIAFSAIALAILALKFALKLHQPSLEKVTPIKLPELFLSAGRDVLVARRSDGTYAYGVLQVSLVPEVVKGDVKRFLRMLYLSKTPFFYHARQEAVHAGVAGVEEENAAAVAGVWKTTILIGTMVRAKHRLEEAVEEARRRVQHVKSCFEAAFPHHRVDVLRGKRLIDAVTGGGIPFL